jgi:hypothetical protein
MPIPSGELHSMVYGCRPYVYAQLFMRVLESYLGDTEKDRVLRDFMDRGAYNLYIEGEIGITELDAWPGVQPGARIVMSVVLEQRRIDQLYLCPGCQMCNTCKEANDGWINW